MFKQIDFARFFKDLSFKTIFFVCHVTFYHISTKSLMKYTMKQWIYNENKKLGGFNEVKYILMNATSGSEHAYTD